jgi:hypothetical protein
LISKGCHHRLKLVTLQKADGLEIAAVVQARTRSRKRFKGSGGPNLPAVEGS